MKLRLEQVPPPAQAPEQPKATQLGLVRGLRVEVTDRQYRCGQCGQMQPRDSLEVWVPDGIRRSDPAWSIEERCRESAFNGGWTAWCVKCAPKASGSTEQHNDRDGPDEFLVIMGVGLAAIIVVIILSAAIM